MAKAFVVLALLFLAWTGSARPAPSQATGTTLLDTLTGTIRSWTTELLPTKRPGRHHWAVVIAGSNGWWNYRHQADVAHAYQVLRNGGLRPDNIVVLMFDDLVGDTNNPHPGELYNRPGGPNVYRGIHIDYSGNDVNSETFLAVLEGNKTAVMGKGTGKVVDSGPGDRVFVFYSDHGSPGVLGMPWGPFLYADELMGVLKRKHAAGGYKEMTLYIEACESGSMFEGLLGRDLPVYATTAANAEESSWGTYCPGFDMPYSAGFDTCLGDLYSVAWMEDSECEDGSEETLGVQFDAVKARTSNNFTYNMGSHAQEYGRLAMRKEVTGSYTGYRDASACIRPAVWGQASAGAGHRRLHVGQRDADLVPLYARVARAQTVHDKQAAQVALDAELARRAAVDRGLEAATAHLLMDRASSGLLLQHLGVSRSQVYTTGAGAAASGRAAGGNRLVPGLPYVQALMSRPLSSRPAGRSLVDDWDCLRSMVAAYSTLCGPMDQYSMRHTRLFANLCNAGLVAQDVQRALTSVNACIRSSQQHGAWGAAVTA